MKPLRVVYLLVLLISVGLAALFYYQYQAKDKELTQYQHLSRLSEEVFTKVDARLEETKRELDRSLKEIENLNKTIADLEKQNLGFKDELQALKVEREKLEANIAGLIEERNILRKKFYSIEELQKAIRIAIKEKIRKRRLAKIEMLRQLDEVALREGNRGYLLRGGKSTFKATKVRVKLEPVKRLIK